MSGQNIVAARNLREMRNVWKSLGGTVEDVRGTGEERYSHPRIPRPITVNKRRKDTPRKLITAFRKIITTSRPAA